jgi:hypothetical protein
MVSILKTSELINSLYEEEKDYDENDVVDYNTFFAKQLSINLNKYCYDNSSCKLTTEEVYSYLNKFEKLDLHTKFEKPEIEEYTNKRLNFLLIIDFLISFDEKKQLNTKEKIFDFFVSLSHFYKFMNYLIVDVNSKLLEYLKYMLVLYLNSLPRTTIDTCFNHIIWELDQFFKFEVVRKIYEIHDSIIRQTKSEKEYIEEKYSDMLEKEHSKIDYTIEEYNFLKNLFGFDTERIFSDILFVKYSLITVPYNPNNNDYDSDDDDDDDVDDEYDDDDDDVDDDYYHGTRKIRQYNIDSKDPLFETYKKMFINRKYQENINILSEFERALKLSEVKIKDFSKFQELHEFSKIKELYEFSKDRFYAISKYTEYKDLVLVTSGELLSNYGDNDYKQNRLFTIIYNMCNIENMQHFFNIHPDFKICKSFELENDPIYKDINKCLLKKYPEIKYTKSTTVYTFK